ncbi:MAG TPA: endonuclease/exonuclease/phosphatase family protein [Myxococcota bacterium]|nr:endonuclease/exonuclease/phosphatase family protein [Myxococcota bacterium]
MRIVGWNIRAGGGARCDAIARQIARWNADVVALSEFRATPASRRLAAALAGLGLSQQRTTADPAAPARNALLVASRWPLRRLRLAAEFSDPHRWLAVRVGAPTRLTLALMHVPNRVTGTKWRFFGAVLACARDWRHGPGVLVGDTNSGRRGLDEEVRGFNAREEAWLDALAECGWIDAFRHLHPAERSYTWYSPNGRNGYRLDQAFVHSALLERVRGAAHAWGGRSPGRRRDCVSDHAACIVDLAASG